MQEMPGWPKKAVAPLRRLRPPRRVARLGRILYTAGLDWFRHGALDQAAAISFYTLFSLAPSLVLAVAVAGAIYGRAQVRAEVVERAERVIGPQASELVDTVLAEASRPAQGITAAAMSLVIMLIGASGAFGQLQVALDRVWEVQLKPGTGLVQFIRTRAASFLMVLIIALLLVAALIASTTVSAITGRVAQMLPSERLVVRATELSALWVMVTILFALIFHFLPDVQLGWREILMGAVITGSLFTVGTYFIGMYLGRTGAGNVYGAAGSLAAVLFWVYYSALIFLYGAEVTHVHARVLGRRPKVKECAEERDED
jgi:membrane protein